MIPRLHTNEARASTGTQPRVGIPSGETHVWNCRSLPAVWLGCEYRM